jgi:hypothetical protein
MDADNKNHLEKIPGALSRSGSSPKLLTRDHFSSHEEYSQYVKAQEILTTPGREHEEEVASERLFHIRRSLILSRRASSEEAAATSPNTDAFSEALMGKNSRVASPFPSSSFLGTRSPILRARAASYSSPNRIDDEMPLLEQIDSPPDRSSAQSPKPRY